MATSGRGPGRPSHGFALIELLVTMMMIGILAAIGLPLLTSQRAKAQDASAKSLAAEAEKALQLHATETERYDATRAELLQAVPDLDSVAWTLSATPASFTLSVRADSDNVFAIERVRTGGAVRRCTQPGAGGCPSSGFW